MTAEVVDVDTLWCETPAWGNTTEAAIAEVSILSRFGKSVITDRTGTRPTFDFYQVGGFLCWNDSSNFPEGVAKYYGIPEWKRRRISEWQSDHDDRWVRPVDV